MLEKMIFRLVISFAIVKIVAHCPTTCANSASSSSVSTFIQNKLAQLGNNIKGYCDIVAVSRNVDLRNFHQPALIFTIDWENKKLFTICNAVFIRVNMFNATAELANTKIFIYLNYASVQLIVIFLQDEVINELVPWMRGIQKNFIVVSGDAGRKVIEYNFSVEERCGTNLRCILYKQRIHVGYSSSKPYFVSRESLYRDYGTDPVVSMTPENLHVIRNYFHGVEADMMTIMVETYDIYFTLMESIFGRELPNGTWTGKFSFLVEKKVQIVIGCLPGNYRRNMIGVYSSQIFVIRFTLTSRKPGLLPSYQAPLRPFPFTAWMVLLVSTIVVGPLTWWVTKQHYKILRREASFKSTSWEMSGHVIRTLVVEPWLNPPEGPASFILTGWFLACMTLQCLYASNLIASFSIPEYQKPVNTFEDARLLQKVVLIKDGSTVSLFLNKTTEEVTFKIVQTNLENSAGALDNFKSVGTHDRHIFRYKVMTESRKMSEFHVSKPFLRVFAGWLYSKDFRFKDAFNMAILRVADTGLIRKWIENQFVNVSIKDGIQEDDPAYQYTALGMDHLKAVFQFWVVGAFISIIALCTEIVVSKQQVLQIGI